MGDAVLVSQVQARRNAHTCNIVLLEDINKANLHGDYRAVHTSCEERRVIFFGELGDNKRSCCAFGWDLSSHCTRRR